MKKTKTLGQLLKNKGFFPKFPKLYALNRVANFTVNQCHRAAAFGTAAPSGEFQLVWTLTMNK